MVYFNRYFVSNILWGSFKPESMFRGGKSDDLSIRGGDASPCPRQGGRSLTKEADPPCLYKNKSKLNKG